MSKTDHCPFSFFTLCFAEFSRTEFIEGAKYAIEHVSHCLSRGNLDRLEGQVTPECLRLLKHNLTLMTPEQRSRLAVNREDIYLSFIYQVGIMLEDHPDMASSSNPEDEFKQTRHVEITFVGHSRRGMVDDVMEAESALELNKKLAKDLRSGPGPMILNYRFIREFTRGVEDSWTINALNHFYTFEMERR